MLKQKKSIEHSIFKTVFDVINDKKSHKHTMNYFQKCEFTISESGVVM